MSLLSGFGGFNSGAQRNVTSGATPATPQLLPNQTTSQPQANTLGGAPNINSNPQPAQPPVSQTAQPTQPVMSNLNSQTNYGTGYTGFGNSHVAAGSGPTTTGGTGNGAPPIIPGAQPIGQYTNQATQLNPNYGPNVHGGATSFINNFNANHPLMNISVDAFNKANGPNTQAAFQMLQQGGQAFRNAVMAANGWSQDDMNRWINQVAYEGKNVFSPQASDPATWAKYGATYAQPTQYGPQPNQVDPSLLSKIQWSNNGWMTPWSNATSGPSTPAAPVPTVNGGTNVYGGNGLSGLPNNGGGSQPPPAPPILSAYGGSATPIAKPKILLGGSR